MPLDAQDKLVLEQLKERFAGKVPHGDQVERHQKLRNSAIEFARVIVETCPASGERTTALQYLEIGLHFAANAVDRFPQ